MSVPRNIESGNSFVTTGNTAERVFSFTCTVDGVYLIKLSVKVYNETDGTAYVQKSYRAFKRVSGTVSALAATVDEYAFGDATITDLISNSGDELYVDLTGVTAKTIDWNSKVELELT